mgnify:CR=1 FL=1
MSHSVDNHGASHGSVKSYMTGFVLSLILTAIPFWMVMDGSASHAMVLGTVVGMAVVQIFVHLIYFLHMNSRSEGGWTLLALMFTLILVVITLAGSLWVMHNLNTHMMPASAHDMKQMP